MGKRRKKLINITKPKLRITSKGVKLQAPRARVGGKAGLNISKSGVSGSVRTGLGTYNTKKGCTAALPCCTAIPVLALAFLLPLAWVLWRVRR